MDEYPERRFDRRRFLKYGGVAGIVTLAGCTGDDDSGDGGSGDDGSDDGDPDDGEPDDGQPDDGDDGDSDDDGDDGDSDDGDVRETFELDGITGGWEGTAPEAIADETNPTLELEAGETYQVVWTNGDGAPHDFTVLDADANQLAGTEIFSEEEESHELEFEATEAMTQYHCSVHPSTMQGEIDIEGADQGEPGGETLIEPGPTVGLETIADGLASPTALATAPGEADRRYILDQPGVIYTHGPDGDIEAFMDITDRVVDLDPGFDERGLLGMAFHPQYQDNDTFYLRYSAPLREGMPAEWDHTSVVAEFETAEVELHGNPESERIVMEYANPQFNHNAGPLAFGPDGLLYIATGDGGGANDVGPGHVDDWYADNEGGNGQDTTQSLLGGILRIDVDSQDEGLEYAIPADNPLADQEGHRGEYYAWGMRNPWGMTFEEETGALLAADVGQNLLETINQVERGGNYGWNVREGTHCFSPETAGHPPDECPDETPSDVRGGEPLLDPIIEYPQQYDGRTIGSSVIGGDMYRTDTVPELEDMYVFADWGGELAGRLFVAYPPEGWPDETAPEQDFHDQTDGHDSAVFDEERWDGLWPIDELLIDADDVVAHEADATRLGHFVLAVERDTAGDLYVLTNASASPTGDGGMVHRIVPPEG